ncbi:unnamed protein product [Candida verbasci]|uniref:Hyphally-regulated cell wall protein N-terminal domain-containing protein n=1 Tax=Candida verbasci TaxID=1227364 RepID=A0A9W4XAX6_9ASCO|nr:unnamed protein product [Candida verbasci]
MLVDSQRTNLPDDISTFPLVGSFEFINEGAICLFYFQALFNTVYEGAGCIALNSYSTVRLESGSTATTDLQVQFKDSQSKLIEDIGYNRLSIIIHGFGNGNFIVLVAGITGFNYNTDSGILTLQSNDAIKEYDIGVGYNPELFELTQVYLTTGTDGIIYNGEVPIDLRPLPASCALCDGTFYNYGYLTEPTAAYVGVEPEQSIELVTKDEGGTWYTSYFPLVTTFTTIRTIDEEQRTSTLTWSYTISSRTFYTITPTPETRDIISTLSIYETNVEQLETTITALVIQSTDAFGDWITTTFTSLLAVAVASETRRVTLSGEDGEFIKDAEVITYNFENADNYYITNTLDDPIAATETRIIEDGDYTEVHIVTSDEDNWWYTTISTIERSSYIYTTTLTNEEGVGTATHIISAIQDQDDQWITQTSIYSIEDSNESTTTDAVIVPTESVDPELPFELVLNFENELEGFSSNGTHLTLFNGDYVQFLIEDTYLRVSEIGYVQISETGLLLVVPKDIATPGWSMEGEKLYNIDYLFEDFSMVEESISKRNYEVYFSFYEDGNGGYVVFAGGRGCMIIEVYAIQAIDEPIDTTDEASETGDTSTANDISTTESAETTTTSADPSSISNIIVESTTRWVNSTTQSQGSPTSYTTIFTSSNDLGKLTTDVAIIHVDENTITSTQYVQLTTSSYVSTSSIYTTTNGLVVELMEVIYVILQGDIEWWRYTSLLANSILPTVSSTRTNEIIPQETSDLSTSIEYVTKVITDCGVTQCTKSEQGEEITIVETVTYCGKKQCNKEQESKSIANEESLLANSILSTVSSTRTNEIIPQETSDLSTSIEYVTKVITDCGVTQCTKGEQGEEITIVETVTYCGKKQCNKEQESKSIANEESFIKNSHETIVETITDCHTKDCQNSNSKVQSTIKSTTKADKSSSILQNQAPILIKTIDGSIIYGSVDGSRTSITTSNGNQEFNEINEGEDIIADANEDTLSSSSTSFESSLSIENPSTSTQGLANSLNNGNNGILSFIVFALVMNIV